MCPHSVTTVAWRRGATTLTFHALRTHLFVNNTTTSQDIPTKFHSYIGKIIERIVPCAFRFPHINLENIKLAKHHAYTITIWRIIERIVPCAFRSPHLNLENIKLANHHAYTITALSPVVRSITLYFQTWYNRHLIVIQFEDMQN